MTVRIPAWLKQGKNIAYLAFGVLSLVLFLALLIWCLADKAEGEVTVYSAQVQAEEGAQTEYLVGQAFNPEGISLNIGTQASPELIPASACRLEADFTTAGKKHAAIVYSPDESTDYVGYFDIEVYFVRGLEMDVAPTEITVNADGTFTCDENFRLLAHLSGMPSDERYFPYAGENCVELTAGAYTVRAVESAEKAGFYTASIYAGNLTYSFNFYQDAGYTFLVSSSNNVVTFEAEEGDAAQLTLVVTDAPDSYLRVGEGSSSGQYIYRDGTNEAQLLPFSFSLDERKRTFSSQDVREGNGGDVYTVSIGGHTFTAAADKWESGVVSGRIYEDGGYLFVVRSANRILELDYQKSSAAAEYGIPSLKLYVTMYEFTMSTGSGEAHGFYLYTDRSGNAFRIPFYMHTWVWDYVPLSGTVGEIDADAIATDYLLAQYTGDLRVEIRTYSRESGWSATDTFSATFGDFRFAAYDTH